MKFRKLGESIKLARERWKQSPEEYLNDAFLAGFVDDYEEAVKILDKGIYLFSTKFDDPDVTWGLNLMRGLTLSKLDRFGEALIAYEECIKIDKTQALLYQASSSVGLIFIACSNNERASLLRFKSISMTPLCINKSSSFGSMSSPFSHVLRASLCLPKSESTVALEYKKSGSIGLIFNISLQTCNASSCLSK